TASEYEVDIGGDFRVIDRETKKIYPITVFRPFITHFTTKQRLTDVLIQKEQYTIIALREIAQEIAREIIYNQRKLK
ncbi:MAG: hypothetical protein N2738_03575, partial [Thermodesulfovibrionales bacterium]|nr:hypothetical protein [Thermodesulfovibrionales bacterium]